MLWYSMILVVEFQFNINSCTISLFHFHFFCKDSVSIRFPNLWYISLLECKLLQMMWKCENEPPPLQTSLCLSEQIRKWLCQLFLLNIQIHTSSSQMEAGERRHDFSITCALPIQRRGARATAIMWLSSDLS